MGQLVEGHFVPVPDGRLYNRWSTIPMYCRPSGTGTDGQMNITWSTIHKSHPPFDHLIYTRPSALYSTKQHYVISSTVLIEKMAF